jgi:hypothetical protein
MNSQKFHLLGIDIYLFDLWRAILIPEDLREPVISSRDKADARVFLRAAR